MKTIEKFILLLKTILILPLLICLVIYFMYKYIKLEFYNENMIEYEMEKYKSGDETGLELMREYIQSTIKPNIHHIYILSIIFWLIIFFYIK